MPSHKSKTKKKNAAGKSVRQANTIINDYFL